MRQPHLLPLALQLHLVGETDLHLFGQSAAVAGFGRLGQRRHARQGQAVVGSDLGRLGVGFDGPVPVHRGLVEKADPLRFLGAEFSIGGIGGMCTVGAVGGCPRRRRNLEFGARGQRAFEHAVDLARQQVVVELAAVGGPERLGVGRHQLAEEVASLRLGPTNQVQATRQFLHELGQLGQKGLAQRRRGLGLHAHEKLATHVAQTRGHRTTGAALFGCAQQHLTPHPADEVAHEFRPGQPLQFAFQTLGIQLAQSQLVLLL